MPPGQSWCLCLGQLDFLWVAAVDLQYDLCASRDESVPRFLCVCVHCEGPSNLKLPHLKKKSINAFEPLSHLGSGQHIKRPLYLEYLDFLILSLWVLSVFENRRKATDPLPETYTKVCTPETSGVL